MPRYSLGCDSGKESVYFLRILIPNGIISTEQFKKIAEISKKFCNGYAEITTRQDIQMHYITGENAIEAFEILEELRLTTDKCGQARPIARYGDVRNIVGCPATGIDPKETLYCYPFVKKIKEVVTGNVDFLDLPRKFKISISGCSINCVSPEIQDLGLIALKNELGQAGFIAFLGGGTGPAPRIGRPLGLFIPQDELINVIVALLEVYRDYGKRENKALSRFKYFVDEWGVNKIREALHKRGFSLGTFDQKFPEISGREHIGINPMKQMGLYYMNVPTVRGRLTYDQLVGIAGIAEEYGWHEIRLTPFQNFIITGIKREDFNVVLSKIEKLGFHFSDSPMRCMALACAQEFCRLSVTSDSVSQRLDEIIRHLENKFSIKLGSLDIKLSISGCPSACSRYPIADIGLQAVRHTENGVIHECYNIYVGGGLGHSPRFGRLVEQAVDKENVKVFLEKLVSAYLCKSTSNESFSDFCKKRTLSELKVLMEA